MCNSEKVYILRFWQFQNCEFKSHELSCESYKFKSHIIDYITSNCEYIYFFYSVSESDYDVILTFPSGEADAILRMFSCSCGSEAYSASSYSTFVRGMLLMSR